MKPARLLFKGFCDGIVDEFDNVPMSGYKLNEDNRFNQTDVIYIDDPRGFTMTISRYNLIEMLLDSSYDHETGFSERFVIGWDDGHLRLFIENSKEYAAQKEYNETGKITMDMLVPGHYYDDVKNTEMLYLGRIPVLNVSKPEKDGVYSGILQYSVGMKCVFRIGRKTYREIPWNLDRKFIVSTGSVPLSADGLERELSEFRKDMGGVTGKFNKIVRMMPDLEHMVADFNIVMKDVRNVPGNEKYTLCQFAEDFKSVIFYKGFSEYDGAVRTVYALPYMEYYLKGTTLMPKRIVPKHSDLPLVSDFIDQNKDAGRLYLIGEMYPGLSRCLVLETDTGVSFNAIESNVSFN